MTRFRLCGDLAPRTLIGLLVEEVPEPFPVFDRLVTVRFVDRDGAYAATDGLFGRHQIRVPPFCLERA